MLNFLETLALNLLKGRLQIPTADLQSVADATAQFTADGQPLTADQVKAADSAIYDYVFARILKGKLV